MSQKTFTQTRLAVSKRVLCYMLFSEALQLFMEWGGAFKREKTMVGYTLILKQFGLFIHNKPIRAIGIQDIVAWFNLMREFHWQQNSFIPKAIALRKFFQFCRMNGYCDLSEELIPIPHKVFKMPRIIDEERYKKLLSAIPLDSKDPRHIRNLAIIKMLWDTGVRNGELMLLDVADLDLDLKRAHINTEKNRGSYPMRLIVWESAQDPLLRWLTKRQALIDSWKKRGLHDIDEKALFFSINGANQGRRLSISGVGEMLRHYSLRAGIKLVSAHEFRHHKGRDIREKGGDVEDVRSILGHASYLSSQPYVQMFGLQQEERFNKFLDKPGDKQPLIKRTARRTITTSLNDKRNYAEIETGNRRKGKKRKGKSLRIVHESKEIVGTGDRRFTRKKENLGSRCD